MADNKTKIIIETESGNSEQKLKNIAKDLQQIGSQSKNTSLQVGQSTTAMIGKFVALGAKVAAVTAVIKRSYSMAREAASFQEIALYTKSAAESIGLSFERLAEASRRGANGMADSATIMKANLKALKQGLNATEEQIGKLWEIANATGDELGQSIEQTFEQITQAINSGNGKALIQLGVIPESFTRASNAAELLTNKSALLKTVLDQLGTSADRLNQYGDTAFDKFQQLENAFSDLKMAASEGLVPALTPVVEMLTEIVRTATKATSAISTLAGLKKPENPYLSLSKDEIDKRINTARNKIAALSYVPGSDPSKSYRESNGKGGAGYGTHIGVAGIEYSDNAGQLEHYQQALAKLLEAKQKLLELDKRREEEQKRIADAAEKAELEKAAKLQQQEVEKLEREAERRRREAEIQREKERQERERILAIQQRQREEEERAFRAYANLAEVTLPKMAQTEAEAYEIALNFAKAAGGIAVGFDRAAAAAKKLEQENPNNFTNLNEWQQRGRVGAGVLSSAIGGLIPSAVFSSALELSEVPEVAKKGWKAIEGQVVNDFSEAVTSGIINSNLGDALRSAISSIAASKAQSYGSNILGSLFGGKGVSTGAITGFLGSVAISAIASNWKKWTGDKNKSETMQSNANTKQRGSNAYLATYSAMLNPYMTNDQYWDLLDSRWASSGMDVSWKSSKRGGFAGLAGGKNYTDTTPQYTYDLINAMENAVKAVEEYNDKKEKELDLLNAQGYSYKVITEQMNALSDTMERVRYMNDEYTHSWSSGETTKLDLSDNIQNLKKAYYEALREYGEETGSRNQQKASTFLSLFPYLDNYDMGSEISRSSNQRIERNDNPAWAYSFIGGTQENLLNRIADPDMLRMIQQAGYEQYKLAELQYTDGGSKYTEAYINVLERQKEAAALVMKEQDRIYNDMTKTFEEQTAALETYQQAMDTYYNTKIEILNQERAKEEQIKKEEQQAQLRSAERMEALLGFTGEMSRTQNNIYMLEGANFLGVLEELQQNVDDPKLQAVIGQLMQRQKNKAKFGDF